MPDIVRRLRSLAAVLFAASLITGVVQAKTPPALSIYGALPGIEMAAISPSGEQIAIVGRVGEGRQLAIVSKDNKPLSTSALGDIKVRGIYWAGEDRVLVHSTTTMPLGFDFTTDKGEMSSMTVVSLNGGKTYNIFGNDIRLAKGFFRRFFGVTRRDNHVYGYFSGWNFEGLPPSFP